MNSNNVNQQLPKFLCIGAQKAATSWLWTILRQHPDVWMPPLKEIHYFDHIFVPENRAWTHNHIKKGVSDSLRWHVAKGAVNLTYFKYLVDVATENPFTEEWYRYCYSPSNASGKMLGDITPEYSTIPEEGIQYVKNLLGCDLKLIYIIRNPVDRAISQLKMNLTRKGMERENDETWMQAAKDPVIQQRGDYKTYVQQWENNFPSDQILYLPYKQVKINAAGLIKSVESHLGISSFSNYVGLEKSIHKTKEAAVPPVVGDYFRTILAEQENFIKTRFGEKFFSLT
jgi:hypothetical protein